jgi:hypothetical protein
MMNAIYICQHFVISSGGLSSDSTDDGQSMQQTSKTFPTMLKLISGAFIEGVNYKEIYMDSEIYDKKTSNDNQEHGYGPKYKYTQNTNLA